MLNETTQQVNPLQRAGQRQPQHPGAISCTNVTDQHQGPSLRIQMAIVEKNLNKKQMPMNILNDE